MKKLLLMLTMMVGGMVTANAADYPYLTFETADGTRTSVSTDGLTISFTSSVLTAGSNEFSLASLSKMYFSESDVSAVESVQENALDAASVKYYDLQGREVSPSQMKQGVYVMVQGSKVIKVQK